MKLELYLAPNTCALVSWVALIEAGADFTARPLNTRTHQQNTPEFLRLNPKHKVPVLVIDGYPLTENVAIQVWIDRQFPHAHLLPQDPMEQVKAISTMAWFASTVHPHLTPNIRPENYCDTPGSEEGVKRVARRLLAEDFAIAEGRLAGRDWFFDHFTIPDVYFFWCVRRAKSFKIELSAFPAVLAHFDRVEQRPSVRKVIATKSR